MERTTLASLALAFKPVGAYAPARASWDPSKPS